MPEYPVDAPLVSVWVTAGERNHIRECLPSFVQQCSYPNYELLFSLYLHKDPNGIRQFVDNFPHPRKRIFDAGDKSLPSAYRELAGVSAEYFLNIGDDFLYLSDPGPPMRDAIKLMRDIPQIAAVRATAHTPLFLDVLSPGIILATTAVGPTAVNFSASDTQHVCRTKSFVEAVGMWNTPAGLRSIQVLGPLVRSGKTGATMLRYWGASVHVGEGGEDGVVSQENQWNRSETEVIRRRGLYGERPTASLYSTWADEEIRREFIYPLYLAGVQPLVAGPVPVSAQTRFGPPEGRLVHESR